MNPSLVEKIANAVLYEGYLLYPYRSSAIKNRQRWNFGVIYPRAYSEMQKGIEPCAMQTECLAEGGSSTLLSGKVRCLRLVERVVGKVTETAGFIPAPSIEIAGRLYESWQEAAECEFTLPPLHFAELAAGPRRVTFALPATEAVEPLGDATVASAGQIVRTQQPLHCTIEIGLAQLQPGLFRIGVRIVNETPFVSGSGGREGVLAGSLLSAHTILHLGEGAFVSLLEPPPRLQQEAAACRNIGAWPVLAGEAGQRDTVLSSPIILYDYPQIAPESAGDLFDGAEIDEILSLRILTLTGEEKDLMCMSDDRARQILERIETLPPEHFMKLHGALRTLPATAKEAS